MLDLYDEMYEGALSRGIDPTDAAHLVRSIEASAERLYHRWPSSAKVTCWVLVAVVVVLSAVLVM